MHILPVNLASTCVISSSLSSNLSLETVISTVNILSSSAITLIMASYSIELWITSKTWLVGIFVLSLFSISMVILYRLMTGTSVVDVVHAAIKAQTPKRKAIVEDEATSTLAQTEKQNSRFRGTNKRQLEYSTRTSFLCAYWNLSAVLLCL